MFYNTINETGDALKELTKNNLRQDEIVLRVFQQKQVPMTPSRVLAWLDIYGLHPPLTSVRRAISDLTKAGLLEMTGDLVTGIYGAKEHKWKLPE